LALLSRPSLGLQHRVLVLCPPVHMVDKVHPVHGILYLFPSIWQLILAAILKRLLLILRKPRIQPVGGSSVMTARE